MAGEKRQFTRITVNVPSILALYQVHAFHSGTLANISPGGCFLSLGEQLPLGENCQVTITVGEGIETENVSLSGQIVRSDAAGVGIKFTDNGSHLPQLRKIIACYASRSKNKKC